MIDKIDKIEKIEKLEKIEKNMLISETNIINDDLKAFLYKK